VMMPAACNRVQAGADGSLRSPGVADERGDGREGPGTVGASVVGQADEHELAGRWTAARHGGPERGQVERPRDRLDAHQAHSRRPATMPGRPPAPGLSFGLIHPVRSRSPANADFSFRPGQVHSRPVADGAAQSSKACGAVGSGAGPGLSSGLIHSRSGPFTDGRPERIRAGYGRWRLQVNGDQHCWRACWVQALGGSNPPS